MFHNNATAAEKEEEEEDIRSNNHTDGNQEDTVAAANVAVAVAAAEVSYCDESKCVSPLLDHAQRKQFYACYAQGDALSPYSCRAGFRGHPLRLHEEEEGEEESVVVVGLPPFRRPRLMTMTANNITNLLDSFDYEYHISQIVPPSALYNYYTCCTPNYKSIINNTKEYSSNEEENSTTILSSSIPSTTSLFGRHCTDPIQLVLTNRNNLQLASMDFVLDTAAMDICHNMTNEYIHPRRMSPIRRGANHTLTVEFSFICCDTELDRTSSSGVSVDAHDDVDFLDANNVTCVPYYCYDKDDNCLEDMDVWGRVEIMACNDPHQRYQYPKIVAQNPRDHVIRFECCLETPSMHKYVLVSYQYYFWPLIIVSSMGMLTSFLLILSITMPFFLQVLRKIIRTTTAGSNSNNTSTNSTTRHPRTTRRNNNSTANTSGGVNGFNMYLVWLSIPDFIFQILVVNRSLQIIVDQGGLDKWPFVSRTFLAINHTNNNTYVDTPSITRAPITSTIILVCTFSTLLLECIISYEIYILLQHSQQLRRCQPPTLRKTVYQATGAYTVAIIFGVIFRFVSPKMGRIGNTTVVYILSTILPLCYVGYICYKIWKQGLLSSANQRLKGLGT